MSEKPLASASINLRKTGLPGYGRLGLALLYVVVAGSLWRFLAISPAPNQIFGVYSNRSFAILLVATYGLLWAMYFVVSRQPNRAKLINVLLTTSSFVFVIGVLELPAFLGILDYRLIISPPHSVLFTQIKPWQDPRNLVDRELGYIRRPGLRIAGETAGDLVPLYGVATNRHYTIDAQYDSKGFRNDREMAQASVVVVGDSFVEAGLVPQNELLTTQMNRLLARDVANLGQSGYGPQQEMIVLRRYGLPLQPKVVVWIFFEGNDLLDVPRYDRLMQNWDSYMKETFGFKERSFTRNVLLAMDYVTGTSFTKEKTDSDEARRRSCRVITGQSEDKTTIYFAYPGVPLSEEDMTSLSAAQDVLTEAQQQAAANGARFLLAYAPTKYRVYHDFCAYPADGYGLTWQLNDLPGRMAAWAGAQGIPYLDLTTALQAAAAQGELVYFVDDGHWNVKGHEVVGKAIADAIKANGW